MCMLRYLAFMTPVAVVSVIAVSTVEAALGLSTLERDLLAAAALVAGLLFGERYGPPRAGDTRVSAGR